MIRDPIRGPVRDLVRGPVRGPVGCLVRDPVQVLSTPRRFRAEPVDEFNLRDLM